VSIPIEQLTTFRSTVYLGLGSNLGDPIGQISRALHEIDDVSGVALTQISSFYRTDPIGFADQPAFVNAVAQIETTLSPQDLMRALLDVEKAHDRVRTEKNGPRSLDLDILIFNEWRLEESDVTVPHPRLHERAFVLVPLLELNPKLYIPGLGFAREYLPSVSGQKIEKIMEDDSSRPLRDR
jgi:2-amino-4-hydroxy-6-hydroxymethyldihydropteridine diphosphokinase